MTQDHVDSYPPTKNINLGWPSPPMNPLLYTDVDPTVDFLTDADLEKELSLYANATFTFDMPPLLDMTRKKIDACPNTNLSTYKQQKAHPISHRHSNIPLTLDIALAIARNNGCPNDHDSSTVSSPYDYQQHQQQQYFTPLPSLPGSPTHDDPGQPHLVTYTMLSPTEPPSHPSLQPPQENYPMYETNLNQMHQSVSTNDAWMTMTRQESSKPTKRRRRTQSSPAKQSPPTEQHHLEVTADMVRLDKRRRNTAASARFRIKKKIREQTLQQTACEMTEKARFFENKVHELEREIKWLKDLLMAKNGCPC
ncbi:hypothetical protein BC941DRAFT_452941 [Chlamydoabsidia padenii]|nr:hypothetical protein BC941DRAFT_452941 [Chlamydoabsidia padenii]